MTVPFVDLKQQYLSIKEEVLAAVAGVFESTQFVLGKEVAAFEEEFASYSDARYGVAVNSGTSALHLALLAAGVGPGDEVITVPFTFVATAAAVWYTGAKPVFVDVDPESYCDGSGPDRRGHYAPHKGNPSRPFIRPSGRHGCDLGNCPASRTAGDRGCRAGSWRGIRGRRCGSIGEMGCFSFYPGKNLGAYGEGGMVTTNNPELARQIRILRDWGAEKKYHHVLKGFNYRMEGVQGAILRVKLRYLEQWTEARRANATLYSRALADSNLHLPKEAPGNRHVYHVYGVMTPRRRELMDALEAQGVQTGIHYPVPVHLLPAYSDLNYQAGDFPIAERLASEELSLPMFPELAESQIDAVVSAIEEYSSVYQS